MIDNLKYYFNPLSVDGATNDGVKGRFYAELSGDREGVKDLTLCYANGIVFDISEMGLSDKSKLFIHEDDHVGPNGTETSWLYSFREIRLRGDVSYKNSRFEHDHFVLIHDYSSPNLVEGCGPILLEQLRNSLQLRSALVLVDWWKDALDRECRERYLGGQFSNMDEAFRPMIDGFNFRCEWGPQANFVDENLRSVPFKVQVSHARTYHLRAEHHGSVQDPSCKPIPLEIAVEEVGFGDEHMCSYDFGADEEEEPTLQ